MRRSEEGVAYTLHHMLRRRSHRLTAVLLMVLSMLFSQLALANYLCPAQAQMAAMMEMMAAGEPCDGKDPAQPALCHQHAVKAAQWSEPVKLPAVSLPAVVQVLVLPLAIDCPLASPLPVAAAEQAQPPPHPIFLSTLRLRV